MGLASFVALSLAIGASPQRHLLFGSQGVGWVVLTDDGVVQSRLSEIVEVQPVDAAISPDGKRWAVVARHDPQQKPELLLLGALDASPRRVISRGNVLDGLRFSDDGEWVYFSSNDENQPTFENQPMLYAQVYRVRFTGGDPQRLSLSRGCHMWPKPLEGSNNVVVSHATCVGGRSLELLNVRSHAEQVLIPPTGSVGETAPHPSGRVILFTKSVPAGTEFRIWDVASGKSTLWGTTEIASARVRPQWAEQGSSVLFQSNDRVWRIDATGAVKHVTDLKVEP